MSLSKEAELIHCAFIRVVVREWRRPDNTRAVAARLGVNHKRVEKVLAWLRKEGAAKHMGAIRSWRGAPRYLFSIDKDRADSKVTHRERYANRYQDPEPSQALFMIFNTFVIKPRPCKCHEHHEDHETLGANDNLVEIEG